MGLQRLAKRLEMDHTGGMVAMVRGQTIRVTAPACGVKAVRIQFFFDILDILLDFAAMAGISRAPSTRHWRLISDHLDAYAHTQQVRTSYLLYASSRQKCATRDAFAADGVGMPVACLRLRRGMLRLRPQHDGVFGPGETPSTARGMTGQVWSLHLG